jgi:hypothetical protein
MTKVLILSKGFGTEKLKNISIARAITIMIGFNGNLFNLFILA